MSTSDTDPASPGAHAPDMYRAVFEMGPDPAVLIDPEAARIVDANAATLRLLGRSREEVVGLTPAELLPDANDGLVAGLRAFAAESAAGRTVIRQLTGCGPTHLLEVHVSLVDLGDRRLILVIGHDATERIAAEQRRARVGRLGRLLMELDGHLAEAMTEEQVWRMLVRRLVDPGGMTLAVVGLVEANGRDMAIQAIEAGPVLAGLPLAAMEGAIFPKDDQMRSCMESGEPIRYRLDGERSAVIDRAAAVLPELDAALLPIRVGRFTVGVIGCAVAEADFFGTQELTLLKQVSLRISTRIGELERSERERQLADALLAERERSARFSSAMATIDREIARTATPADIYEALCRLPVELGVCVAAWTGLTLNGRRGQELRLAASAGDAAVRTGLIDPASAEIMALPQMAETMIVDDMLADGRFRRKWKDLERAGVRGMMAVPFRIGPTLVGAVTCYAREPGTFGADRVALLERLAANAGGRLGVIQADQRRWHAEEKLARMEASPPPNAGEVRGPSH